MTEKMKPSGIAWIGDVPESWNLLKLKYFSYLKGRIGWQGLTADEFIDEGPYLITGTDFENGRIQFDRSYHISEARYAQAPEIQLQIGDLLVTKDGTVGKMAYVDELPGKASLNSHLLLIRPLEGKYHNRFLFWLMSSSVFTGYTEYSQDGTIMASLSQEKIGNFLAYFPGLEEQCAIADFLDAQCAKIDSVIVNIEKQIETLQKYKKSLIIEVVTKGLDQSAPMKDSSVEWVGEVPNTWDVMRIKDIAKMQTGTTPPNNEGVNYDGDGISWFTPTDFTDGSIVLCESEKHVTTDIVAQESLKVFPPHSVLFVGIASVGKIGYCDRQCYSNQQITAIKPKNISDSKYIAYALLASMEYTKSNALYTTVPIINNAYLGTIKIPYPPTDEQRKIVDFLDDKCQKIDEIVSSKTSHLELMQQHKKSLIYEYVTGKKRVTEVN